MGCDTRVELVRAQELLNNRGPSQETAEMKDPEDNRTLEMLGLEPTDLAVAPPKTSSVARAALPAAVTPVPHAYVMVPRKRPTH